MVRGVEFHGPSGVAVPAQGLFAVRVAQVEALGPDQIGRGGAVAQVGDVADGAPVVLVQDDVDEGEQEGGVGLRAYGHPFVRGRGRDPHVGLQVDAPHAAPARLGAAPHALHAARRVHVLAARDDVAGERRVLGHREGAVPELAIEMFGVGALDALAGAVALVDLAPGGEEGRPRALVGHRDAAAAADPAQLGVAIFVAQVAAVGDLVEPRGDQVQGLVPAYRLPARVHVLALLGVGALHGLLDAVRVVGLLDEPVGLDADAPAGGMDVGRRVVGLDLGGVAVVVDLDGEQVGAGHALVAVDRNLLLAAAALAPVVVGKTAGAAALRRARAWSFAVRCHDLFP